MGWPQEKVDALARVIAECVPIDTLREVVQHFGVIADFETLLKLGPQDPSGKAHAMALAVVTQHNAVELACRLAEALYYRLWRDAALGPALAPFTIEDDAAQQAALAKRAATLSDEQLGRFLEETRPRICLVCASIAIAGEEQFRTGTGFLVGPDLVLTARHVLRGHIRGDDQVRPAPGRLAVLFDHFFGSPVVEFPDGKTSGRLVAFAEDWLVASSQEMEKDGMLRQPTDAQIAQMRDSLDMVLVRLTESIGYYTRSSAGGQRRLWFDIPEDAVPAGLREDDRVIIRQHPHGHALRIDFGRYKQVDQSATRIRYSTETSKGTSGAPCFNQNFCLIGMHNAEYRPDGAVAVLNQAIRFDHISNKIRNKLKGFNSPSPMRIWSAGPGIDLPSPIIGRTKFIDWIERASEPLPATRSDRIFAAVSGTTGSGRTFSVSILRAARRSLLDRIVVLGTDSDAVPNAVSDLVAVILDQLRIPLGELVGLPPRPGPDLAAASSDGDKLHKWASEDVPRWFDGVLRKQRLQIVDRRQEAREIVAKYAELGRDPPPDEAELARRSDEVREVRHRWERIWIIIDRLNEEKKSDEVRLSQEICNLIAGLTGGQASENAVGEELRRLRWIFLGQKPDFITASCNEELDPASIGENEMIACIATFADTFNKPLSDGEVGQLRAFLKVWMINPDVRAKLAQRSERLATMQSYIGQLAPALAAEFRGRS